MTEEKIYKVMNLECYEVTSLEQASRVIEEHGLDIEIISELRLRRSYGVVNLLLKAWHMKSLRFRNKHLRSPLGLASTTHTVDEGLVSGEGWS